MNVAEATIVAANPDQPTIFMRFIALCFISSSVSVDGWKRKVRIRDITHKTKEAMASISEGIWFTTVANIVLPKNIIAET